MTNLKVSMMYVKLESLQLNKNHVVISSDSIVIEYNEHLHHLLIKKNNYLQHFNNVKIEQLDIGFHNQQLYASFHMEGYKAKNVNNIIKPFRSQACNLYASQKLYNVRCDQLNPHGFTAHTHSY